MENDCKYKVGVGKCGRRFESGIFDECKEDCRFYEAESDGDEKRNNDDNEYDVEDDYFIESKKENKRKGRDPEQRFLATFPNGTQQPLQFRKKRDQKPHQSSGDTASLNHEMQIDDKDTKRTGTAILRIIRDTKKGTQLKMKYEYRCQICGFAIEHPSKRAYCEVHHIIPLGIPHNGRDTQNNMICLCPNHHAEMDYGVFFIDPETKNVVYYDRRNKFHEQQITLLKGHRIKKECLEYHKNSICNDWSNDG